MLTNIVLKQAAIALRKKGWSYPMIEKKLGTPRATLNGWFKGLILGQKAQRMLVRRKQRNLVLVRKKALVVLSASRERVHRALVQKVQAEIDNYEFSSLSKEIFLCGLYLGEGFKRKSTIGLGNSNPKILASFVSLVRSIYSAGEERFTCYLHLRYDQDEKFERTYWSKKLNIPEDHFRKTQFDKRTIGKKTWSEYHGVCVVYCHDARIEKRLTILQDMLLNKAMGN